MCLVLVTGHADAAKRFGGGKSFGQQSSNVTQRQVTPMAPATGVNSTAKSPAPTTPAAAAAAPKKPWGAMLGGLAAGLGLAWLASSLGLGEAMGQFMMFALRKLHHLLRFRAQVRWGKHRCQPAIARKTLATMRRPAPGSAIPLHLTARQQLLPPLPCRVR